MQQKLTYEQIITAKLDTLPLPDMADLIWNRIEKQLDIEMPTDDGPGGDDIVPTAPSPGLISGGILGIFLLALLTYFLIQKSNSGKEREQNNTAPSMVIPAEKKIEESPSPGEKVRQIPIVINAKDKNLSPVDDSAGDRESMQPVLTGEDSSQLQDVPAVVLPLTPISKPADSVNTGRKKRGAQGIDDSDYRIIPKNDSIN